MTLKTEQLTGFESTLMQEAATRDVSLQSIIGRRFPYGKLDRRAASDASLAWDLFPLDEPRRTYALERLNNFTFPVRVRTDLSPAIMKKLKLDKGAKTLVVQYGEKHDRRRDITVPIQSYRFVVGQVLELPFARACWMLNHHTYGQLLEEVPFGEEDTPAVDAK